MERFCSGILAAAMVSFWLPVLPASPAPFLLIGMSLLVCTALRQWLLVGALLFLLSLSLQLQHFQTSRLAFLSQHTTVLAGTVVSIPQQDDSGSRFILQLGETVKGKPQSAAAALVSVRWPEAPVRLSQGQRWQFYVKLKPIRGPANFGASHREANALVQRLLAHATVSATPEHGRSASAVFLGGHAGWRQRVYDQLQVNLHQLPTAPLLIALTVGERPFSDDLWQGLQATGLGHLISISGMHIALLFGWVMLLRPLWQWLPLPLPHRQALLLGTALLAAWGYSLLAGFAIPTLRALWALAAVVLLKLLWRRCSGRQFTLLISALLLLWQPFWLLSISFWLSVSAVALVFYLAWRYPPPVGWRAHCWHFLRYQWLFSLLMLPLGLLLFQGIAPLALLSNLLFVPWCTVLAIPLLMLVFLLQLLTPMPIRGAWQLLDWIFQPLSSWLALAARYEWWWSVPQPTLLVLLLSVCAGLCLLLPGKNRGWLLAACCIAPLLIGMLRDDRPKLHLLDVGQGTAVLLQQGSRGLLYDLGPRYGHYSATRQLVLPYLRYQGIRQLDYVVLSHDDSDHTGDPAIVQQAYPDAIWATDIRRLQPQLNCRQLPLQWQQFALQQLWPPAPAELLLEPVDSKNDRSCVLLIDVAGWRVLLTGDISRPVERILQQRYPGLQADILLLGHHGSQTSSDSRFLQQLQLQLALNSAGWRNHYQHPATSVLATLSLLQIPLYNTAQTGAVEVEFSVGQLQIRTARQARLVKWLEKLSADAETPALTR